MKKSVFVLLSRAVQEVFLDYTSSAVKILLAVVIFAYLSFNIYESQRTNELYFAVIKEKKPAAIIFLQKIRTLGSFSYFLNGQSSLFGPSLRKDVEKEKIERQEQIQTFLALLQAYPASRDLLYGLSVLYRENGQIDKANEYLFKARKIDPIVQ